MSKQEEAQFLASKKGIIDAQLTGKVPKLRCKNTSQKEFVKLINEKEIVFGAGVAGTGKTYLSIHRALELLKNKSNPYEKLVISKPYIDLGRGMGFLPGDMREKMQPYMQSATDVIDKIIGKYLREVLIQSEVIEIQPLAFIRGKSFDNTILVMEEAQNMTPNEMKTLLTRIGENSKYIISGDLDQTDLNSDFTKTGLYDAFDKHKEIEELGFFTFSENDVVRNPVIMKILKNYSTIQNNL